MSSDTAAISNLGALRDSYKYGFVTDIESCLLYTSRCV